MRMTGRFLWFGVGLVLGGLGVGLCLGPIKPVAAANDRFEDYVMCTGPAGTSGKTPVDGVWLLDYRSGKLQGTMIDRGQGKISGWAEVDLLNEFGLAPRQNVHFLMTTGMISQGQSALYVAETMTGKFAVYTMGPRGDGNTGVQIRRHDLAMFRSLAKAGG